MLKNYDKKIRICGEEYTVFVSRKRVKRLNMRVRGEEIFVSAPTYLSDARIDAFISDNAEWLKKHLTGYRNKPFVTAAKQDKIFYLGKEFSVSVRDGRSKVERNDDAFVIYAKDGDREKAKKVFLKYWAELAKGLFEEETKKAFASCKEAVRLTEMPTVTVSKVRGYWGKCFPKKKEIRYNVCLLQADINYIRYVAFHELAHFRHANHGKDFYTLLRQIFPDAEKIRRYNKNLSPTMWTDI